jgi:leucine-rich repeat protein SHOC2
MEQAELEQIIEQARLDRATKLHLNIGFQSNITMLPDSLGKLTDLIRLRIITRDMKIFSSSLENLTNLTHLWINSDKTIFSELFGNLTSLIELVLVSNQIETIPDSIGNLVNLNELNLNSNQIENLPDSIGRLTKLKYLYLDSNKIINLPNSLGNLTNLTRLSLRGNKLVTLSSSLGNLNNLTDLSLDNNKLTTLPSSLVGLSCLIDLSLNDNPLTDLSILQDLPSLTRVAFFDVNLPRRYWCKISDWKSEWLLDEDNTKIRQILIEQLGYEKIFKELNSFTLDNWREYTLIKINDVEEIYYESEPGRYIVINTKPMVLLKMTCPSTQHIHILRVPPEMESAEAAITWVNHGIHPDKFAVQT